ncbi:MAG: Rne/Rng family ribonuclease [Rhodospirillaceae bacterium]
MVKRMLIDATHAEETRVVVLDGTRLEEFDVETSTKKQIKGNIYLAKVVRVEPSLQAAFVDYGGNRHGFLAFSEIHPDYYQIPVADRERLLAEQERHEREEEERAARRRARREAQAATTAAQGAAAGQGSEAQGGAEGAGAAEGQAPFDAAHDDHAHDDHPHDDHPHDDHPHGDHPHGDHAHDDDHHDHGDHPHHDHDHDHTHDHTHDHPGEDHHHDDHHDGDVIPLAYIPPAITSELPPDEDHDEPHDENGGEGVSEVPSSDYIPETVGGDEQTAASVESARGENGNGENGNGEAAAATRGKPSVESVGGDDDEEEDARDDSSRRRFVASRHYKIQEVIKRRQIMLVQVVKEERGNKGAALTTYLSLAGRYCVLMPNSARGGGVSRKITSAQDRRRLKQILGDLELPTNMGVILRTAGSERSRAEIKRDYEYLQRTWNNIREVTMQSRAPALIHEEASLIKRAIRDIYSRDLEEVWVDGEEGYKIAKDFMRMLTPSHAKKVQRYKDDIIPLFHRYQVETQMESINSPVVQLRSGGSIVFAQTEALVAIDVNSGRATKERHIEETAFKTNMEAAEEIARQLRLRDLAGLIVIDFIDMEDNRNNHAVERRLKESLKADRARIQVGRISHFGLLELSRQRLRPSLIEANFRTCSHCAGTGMIRSTESAAVHSLRMLEEEGVRQRSSEVTITVHPDVALYLLNYKREALASIESRYGIKIFVMGDAHLIPPNLRLDRVKAMRAPGEGQEAREPQPVREIAPPEAEEEEEDIAEEAEADEEAEAGEARGQGQPRGEGEEEGGRRRRRRRRRRGRGGDDRSEGARHEGQRHEHRQEGGREGQRHEGGRAEHREEPRAEGEQASEGGEEQPRHFEGGDQGQQREGRDSEGRRRRRGRRGGRRRRRGNGEPGEHGEHREHGEHHAGEHESSVHQPAEHQGGNGPSTPAAPISTADAAEERSWPEMPTPAPEPTSSPAHVDPAGADGAPEVRNGTGPSRFFRAIKEGVLGRRGDAEPPPIETRAEPPRVEAKPEPAPVIQPPPEPEPAGPPRKGWWSNKN